MGDEALQLHDHVRAMRRYAMALTGNPSETDDLVQESLHRVLAALRRGKTIDDMRAYLFSVLHNLWIDQSTSKSRSQPHLSLDDGTLELIAPANQVFRAEWKATVEGIGRLPQEQREVVLLVGLEGFSYQEAASLLGIPLGTVMSRLSRGRETLRRLLDSVEETDRRTAR